jgi:hypothetical protein
VRIVPDVGEAPCSDCGGETIQFRGRGLDLEVRICPRKDEPGHLSRAAAQKIYDQRLRAEGYAARRRFA